jgi:hypothetical protein
MVGGKESKLQHAWGLASLLAPLSRRDSMAAGWSWKPCRRRSETRSFGAKRSLTKGCLRLLNYEYTH